MSDGRFPTLVSKNRTVNSVTNGIFIEATNGTSAGLTAGTGATDLGKAVNAVAGASDTGVALLGVRDDALTTLTPVDGDYVRARFTSTGALWVEDVNAGSAAVQVDDAAFTVAVSSVSMSGFLMDEVSPDTLDEGDGGAARVDASRRQLIRVVGATDANRLDINASGHALTAVQSQIPGTGATNLGKAVDSAGGATDTGVASLFIVDAVLSAITPADGDYARGRLTANGALWVSDVTLDANSETNPLFVHNVNTVVSGSEVIDEDEGVDVGSDTADNHDYTVVGTTFLLKAVDFGSSGATKVEVWAGPIASLVRYATRFIPPHSGGGQIRFDPAVEVPVTSTGTVRVIRTNREGGTNSVYSTIMGNDV